jgi:hypothetical protein
MLDPKKFDFGTWSVEIRNKLIIFTVKETEHNGPLSSVVPIFDLQIDPITIVLHEDEDEITIGHKVMVKFMEAMPGSKIEWEVYETHLFNVFHDIADLQSIVLPDSIDRIKRNLEIYEKQIKPNQSNPNHCLNLTTKHREFKRRRKLFANRRAIVNR